ncbi:hypothetical protein DL96DRAFT_1619057 [Flagelloscypha sp. PMI_526]|nr:hypothetical protein DL96DRAFT_1619057 [Flagelloscypha sp. PMI_526]
MLNAQKRIVSVLLGLLEYKAGVSWLKTSFIFRHLPGIATSSCRSFRKIFQVDPKYRFFSSLKHISIVLIKYLSQTYFLALSRRTSATF